jgi:hypothetical protein
MIVCADETGAGTRMSDFPQMTTIEWIVFRNAENEEASGW